MAGHPRRGTRQRSINGQVKPYTRSKHVSISCGGTRWSCRLRPRELENGQALMLKRATPHVIEVRTSRWLSGPLIDNHQRIHESSTTTNAGCLARKAARSWGPCTSSTIAILTILAEVTFIDLQKLIGLIPYKAYLYLTLQSPNSNTIGIYILRALPDR